MNLPIDVATWFNEVATLAPDALAGNIEKLKSSQNSNDFTLCLAQLFFHNATLWGYEDEVRRTDVSDGEIAKYKRLIDRENQLRNDHIDKADSILRGILETEGKNNDKTLPINTETPGSVFDRLTILALRKLSLNKEIERDDATEEHKEKCREKLLEVEERISDLIKSLDCLLNDIFEGHKQLKSYGTHKLYNDPETNPAVRQAR